MPTKEIGLECAVCGRQTLHRKTGGVNHVLHFLISFFSCGLWVIPWIFMSINQDSEPYVCTFCGTRSSYGLRPAALARAADPGSTKRSISIVAVVIAGLVGLVVVASLVTAYFGRKSGGTASTSPATRDTLPPAPYNLENDRILAMTLPDRNAALAKVLKEYALPCAKMERVVYKGLDADKSGHWGVGCSGGKAYVVTIGAGTGSLNRVLTCSSATDCFKPLQ